MTRRWQLGRLIPLLLTLFLVLDVALRVLPVERLSFRAWEAATQYAPYQIPFEPSRRFHLAREHGDLANLGNLPNLREYRAGTTFTTDSAGFRNSTGTHSEAGYGAILIGDSFGVGATVNDAETLPVQLGVVTGCKVYNAAGSARMSHQPGPIITLAQHLRIRGGLVVAESLESALVTEKESVASDETAERLVAMIPPRLLNLLVRVWGLWKVSPFQVLLNRAVRRIEDDRILPNSHASSVVQRTLRNGEKILFAPEDIVSARSARGTSIDRWVRLTSRLDNAGLKLLVVLVPRKYTVYQPLLLDEEPLTPVPGGALGHVERQLQRAGIAVVNLTEALRAHAARGLAGGTYLYWRDDTHWNARGIAVAASEISRAWPATNLCRREE